MIIKGDIMKELFKNKDFTLLFSGHFISQIGSVFYNFAVGWFLLSLTESPLIAGMYIALGGIITILTTSISGVFIDRMNKVFILYITDFIRGFTILLGGFIMFTLNHEVYLIALLFSITVILALNNAFFHPASTALRPEVVADENLNQANALFSFIASVQMIIGLLLAGLLYSALGIELIFLINGISFIISGISEIFIKRRYDKPKQTKLEKKTFREDFIVGIQYIVKRQGLLMVMVSALLLNFAFAPFFANILPYLFNLVLEKEPLDLSIVQITASFGMLVSGIIIGIVGKNMPIKSTILRGLSFTGAGFITLLILIMAVSSNTINYQQFMILFLPVMFLTMTANVWVNVPFMTGMLRTIDKEVRGRVFGLMDTISQAMTPLAFLLAGLLLEYGSLYLVSILLIIIYLIPFSMMMWGRKPRLLLDSF